jgi:hypothetical protein
MYRMFDDRIKNFGDLGNSDLGGEQGIGLQLYSLMEIIEIQTLVASFYRNDRTPGVGCSQYEGVTPIEQVDRLNVSLRFSVAPNRGSRNFKYNENFTYDKLIEYISQTPGAFQQYFFISGVKTIKENIDRCDCGCGE